MKRSLALFAALVLTACGLLPEKIDETRNWSAARLYEEAKSELDGANYTKAIQLFETLESRYPYGRYAQQAQLEVAYAYFKDNEPASAVAACDRFIKLHPNHAHVDYAYYLKGLVNFNEDLGLLGNMSGQDLTERDPNAARESFEAFKELVTRFPGSKYAADAVERMKYLVNMLAWHEVHVARYYLKRHAYVAAAARAQHALATYPQAPATEDALFLMVQAYQAMGLDDLRSDAERVMRKNFPASKYLAGAQGESKGWWRFW